MKTKNYLFLLLLILLISSNFFLFPKFNFYINYSGFSTIIIGVLGAFLAFNTLKCTKIEKTILALFLPTLVFISLLIFNVFYSAEIETEILKKDGVQTTAEIINKEHFQLKRAETYEFIIRFRNERNELIQTKMSTLQREYENHNIGDNINIKYSSENNELVELISE